MDNHKKATTVEDDVRFAHVAKDPRYFKASRKRHKIRPDERFSAMLTDDRFIEKTTMDPRGRPKSFSSRDDLKRLYNLSSDSEEEEIENVSSRTDAAKTKNKDSQNASSVKSLPSSNRDESTAAHDPQVDYARGIAMFPDDSSSDDSSTTEDDEDDEEEEFEWGEIDRDAVWETDEAPIEESSRIALCNMDWDRVNAKDLMVLFSSFVPQEGRINKVTIYLSDFGKERLDFEERKGPQELVTISSRSSSDADKELRDLERIQKGKLSHQSTNKQTEALRRYQRNRLKYFYAVIECDSKTSAAWIYKECDRMPFEGAGGMLDLRYIPDGMEFDIQRVKDTCTTVPHNYENPIFQTSVLLDSKPTLTWDETDNRRKNTLAGVMARALKKEDYDEELLKDYIASSSGGESESESESLSDASGRPEDTMGKFSSQIKSLHEENLEKGEKDIDKEATFHLGSSDEDAGDDPSQMPPQEAPTEELTPFEKILEKRRLKNREKKLAKKERKMAAVQDAKKEISKKRKNVSLDSDSDASEGESKENGDLALLLMDGEEDDQRHFSMRRIVKMNRETGKKERKAKRNKKFIQQKIEEKKATQVDDFKIDAQDPRFSSLFSSADFILDPSHPSFKPTGAMRGLVKDIQAKRVSNSTEKVPECNSHSAAALTSLARKVKVKFKK